MHREGGTARASGLSAPTRRISCTAFHPSLPPSPSSRWLTAAAAARPASAATTRRPSMRHRTEPPRPMRRRPTAHPPTARSRATMARRSRTRRPATTAPRPTGAPARQAERRAPRASPAARWRIRKGRSRSRRTSSRVRARRMTCGLARRGAGEPRRRHRRSRHGGLWNRVRDARSQPRCDVRCLPATRGGHDDDARPVLFAGVCRVRVGRRV